MANRRMLSKTVSTSEKLLLLYEALQPDGMGEFGQLLYSWLIPHADDYGRFDASPRIIKLRVMPGSDRPIADFKKAIEAMEKVDLIKVYGNGKKYLEIIKFEKFQTFRKDRERQEEYPSPTSEEVNHANDIPETYQEHTEVRPNLREGKLREGNASLLRKEEDFILPSKEEIQNFSEPKLEDAIESICKQLYEKEIFSEVFAFKSKMANGKQSKRALLHTLGRCYLTKPKEPWPYCQQVMKIENGNFNEKEHRKDH
jgi:hypothetical protein